MRDPEHSVAGERRGKWARKQQGDHVAASRWTLLSRDPCLLSHLLSIRSVPLCVAATVLGTRVTAGNRQADMSGAEGQYGEHPSQD